MVEPIDITDEKRKYRRRNEGEFPDQLTLTLKKEWDLKYGENPAQHGAIYTLDSINNNNARTMAELTDLQSVREDGKGKGGLSLTNTLDISRGMDTLKFHNESPSVVILKHNVVSGFVKQTGPQGDPDANKIAQHSLNLHPLGWLIILSLHFQVRSPSSQRGS